MSPQSLCTILNNNEFIYLGRSIERSRISKLFFSTYDDKFFVAIQDEKSGYVVTILTIKYWQNLSKKYLRRNKKVTKIDLLAAIRAGDPSNRILKNTPIIGNKIINFKVIVKYKSDNNWPYKFIKAGSIDSNILYEKSSEDILNNIKSQFIKRLENKGFIESDVVKILWGIGNEPKIQEIEIYNSIDYSFLTKSVKDDIYIRNNLINKYDDFLELLNTEANNRKKEEKDCKGKKNKKILIIIFLILFLLILFLINL